MKKCAKCKSYIPNWITIEGVKKNLSKRRFCLSCSPFGLRNRIDYTKYDDREGYKTCRKCETEKHLRYFYKCDEKRDKASSVCKSCHGEMIKGRLKGYKRLCLDYKGSKCSICGYNRCVEALEFHHRDNIEKEFSISNARFKKFDDRTKKELDKCDVLCANCHREVHAGVNVQGSFSLL